MTPGQARGQAFEAQETIAIGKPPRAAVVRAHSQGEAGVELQVDGLTIELPLEAVVELSAQSVEVAPRAAVGVVIVEGLEGRRAGALIGRRGGRVRALWSGRLGLQGDPGERHGHAIEIADRTSDGVPDVILGELSERARVCGQAKTLLRPQAVDPNTLTLRAVTLDPLASSERETVEVDAVEQGPGPTGAPVLRSLVPVAASSQPGEQAAWMASPPLALVDGDPATFWSEGRGAGGRGEFVTLRWDAGDMPIRAIAFTPVPKEPPSSGWSQVRSLWLAGEQGPRFKLRFPQSPLPGARYWFVPEEPLRWNCVSLIVEETAAAPQGAGPVLLAEVETYTELDFGQGLVQLVGDLNLGSQRAARASDLLLALGEQALPTLREAWPQFQAGGRRRALRLFAVAAPQHASAREALIVALDDSEPEIQARALEALLDAGEAGWMALLPRVAEASGLGDDVALALARRAPVKGADAVLAALSASGGSERAALREALALASQQQGEAVLAAVESWRQSDIAGLGARAAVALALAKVEGSAAARELARELVRSAAGRAQEFSDRWRLVQAASVLPPEPEVDRWLANLALEDERWMLRAAAVSALAERDSPLAEPTARKALEDSYPRVRIAGSEALRGHAGAVRRLSKHARRDRWPMVRAAAMAVLAESGGTQAALREGLDDRAQSVRAAAVRALRTAKAREAWPAVRARLVDENEWPSVVTEAIQFARALCIAEAAEPMLNVLKRGLKPDAWEPDVDAGLVALEALSHLGGQAAASALALASSPTAPAGFQTAARLARRQKPECSRASERPES